MSDPLPPKTCPTCGKTIPPSAPGGWCPACLLERLMGEPTDPSLPDTVLHPLTPSDAGTARALEQPERIGPYRILEKIGEGGFGIVFRAEQTAPLRREVALKIIRPGMASADIIARFEAERQTLAMMEHPNIAHVYDAGTTPEGLPYFVMEFVPGAPVTTFCDQRRLTVRERLELFAQVCDAVQHAHQKAVLHRDLKPSNILIAELDGRPVPKVIDFGIAKALEAAPEEMLQASLARTRAGMVVGTPQYMSPEQAGATSDVDTRSDVYMLGAVLHELLTGQTPLSRDELKQAAFDEVLRLIREGEVRRPSSRLTPVTEAVRQSATTRQVEPGRLSHTLRGDLDWIMLKALEKERERRYQSASLLADEVRRYLRDEPTLAGPPQFRYRAAKFLRRHRGPVAAAAIITLTLLGATVFSAREAQKSARARLVAEAAEQKALSEAAERQRLLRDASKFSHRTAMSLLRDAKPGDEAISDALAHLARSLRFDPSNTAAQATAILSLTANPPAIEGRFPLLTLRAALPPCLSPDGHRMFTIEEIAGAPSKGVQKTTTRPSLIETSLGTQIVHRKRVDFDEEIVAFGCAPVSGRFVFLTRTKLVFRDAELQKYAEAPISNPSLRSGSRGKFRLSWATEGFQFSPDGRWMVLVWSGEPLRIWSMESGAPVGPALVPAATGGLGATDAEFSKDGTQLLTVEEGRGAFLWQVPACKLAGTLPQEVSSAAFFPSSGRIVFAAENSIRFWDAEAARPLATEACLPANPRSRLVVGPSGVHLVAYSRFWGQTLQFWDRSQFQDSTGEVDFGRPPPVVSIDGRIEQACFSPDGGLFAAATSSGRVAVYPTSSRDRASFSISNASAARYLSFAGDGSLLITQTGDRAVNVWQLPPRRASGRVLTEARSQIEQVILSLRKGAPGSSLPPDLRAKAALLLKRDTASGTEAASVMRNVRFEVPGSRTSKDLSSGRILVNPSRDYLLIQRDGIKKGEAPGCIVWRTRDWTVTAIIPTALGLCEFGFPDEKSRVLMLTEERGDDKMDKSSIKDFRLVEAPGMLSHRERLLVTNGAPHASGLEPPGAVSSGRAKEWAKLSSYDMESGQLLRTAEFPLGSDGFEPLRLRNAVAITVQGRVRILSGDDFKELRHLRDVTMPSLRSYSDDEAIMVASRGAKNKLAVLDLETDTWAGAEISGDGVFLSAAFSPASDRLLTVSERNVIELWDWRTGSRLGEPMIPPGPVNFARFDPSGRWICVTTSGLDARTCLWEVSSGAPVFELSSSEATFGSKAGWLVLRQAEYVGNAMMDGCRLIELPANTPVAPPELPALLELLAGKRVDTDKGAAMPISQRDAKNEMQKLQDQIARRSVDQDTSIGKLIRWSLANPRTRRVSPGDPVTVDEYVEELFEEMLAEPSDLYGERIADEIAGTDPVHPLTALARARFRDGADADVLLKHGVARLFDPSNEAVYAKERRASHARLAFRILLPAAFPNRPQAIAWCEQCLMLVRRLDPACAELPALEQELREQEKRLGAGQPASRRSSFSFNSGGKPDPAGHKALEAEVSRSLATPPAPKLPKSFAYLYKFGDDAGPRVWTRQETSWTERSPKGKERKFLFERTEVVLGSSGVIVRAPGTEFRVFISAIGSREMRLFCRDGEGEWRSLGQMVDIKE